MTTVTLNADQEEGARKFFSFLLSDRKELSVTGPAGTGKTTFMGWLMNQGLEQDALARKILGQPPMNLEVELTATTNKAAEVLNQATRHPTHTIQSYLRLKVKDDYVTGASRLIPRNDFEKHSGKLIIIDEASMVDRQLHHFIHAGTDDTCKIVYFGDRCQLAPVGDTISPVYEDLDPAHLVSLTIPMRNAGQPALMALCDQLRANVDNLDFQPIAEVPGVIDYVTGPTAQAAVDGLFAQETDDARALFYTNARVGEFNGYIRDLRGYPSLLTKGERVVNNSGMEIGKDFLRVEEELRVHTVMGEPYVVDLDGGAQMDVYRVQVERRNGLIIEVRVPVYPDHFKQLTRYYASQKNWPAYFDLKNNYPDLRPKDAATVHKSQGSSYDTVFVDLQNIGTCDDPEQVARMLYVAVSRARQRVLLFGTLPPRYSRPLQRLAAQ